MIVVKISPGDIISGGYTVMPFFCVSGRQGVANMTVDGVELTL